MSGTTLVPEKAREKAGRAKAPAPTDVKLAADWLDRWLMELDLSELRTYLQLAHFYNTRTFHDRVSLERVLPIVGVEQVIERLEKRGLVEVIRKDDQFHYHFPHRDTDGFHRAERARPSLVDALAFQERMTEELTELTEQDETDSLRERYFTRYPQLKGEYELWRSAGDEGMRWRLWMELSRHLIRKFEDQYGSLREDHGELFKEVSSKVLRHHLDVVDGVVKEILRREGELFPEVQAEWVIVPPEEHFVSLPVVRQLAQRYGIGPEQIFLNTIEEQGNLGRVVVGVDEDGFLSDMVLPADTGLTKSEERVLFLRPEERDQEDSERNQERVRRARNKYANYLIGRASGVLADFVAAKRVRGIDAWLIRIVDLVNDALDALPMADGQRPVLLEHVIDRYDAVRQGVRHPPRPRLPAAPAERGARAPHYAPDTARANSNGARSAAAPAKSSPTAKSGPTGKAGKAGKATPTKKGRKQDLKPGPGKSPKAAKGRKSGGKPPGKSRRKG